MRFEKLWQEADAAGKAAAAAIIPRAMVVSWREGATLRREYVAEGVCGFAWVKFPGNGAFGRWAKKQGLARKGYGPGLEYWISDYNQSMQRKEAYAIAFAKILREAGISAYADSRMD